MHLVPDTESLMRIAIELTARDFDALAADAAKNSLCIQEQIVEAIRYCHHNRVSFLSAEVVDVLRRGDCGVAA